ncbi:MAG: acyl-CoA dehydrogenase family protein [Verrucomicrobiota bacterium]
MSSTDPAPTLQALPSDQLRALQWRFADRFDLTMLIQSVRPVARGPVARLVAAGGRNTHDWTHEKNALLAIYDESGITAAFLEPEFGGFIEGPKNLALALVAFELSWVDAGAATCSLASNLGVAPIHERGTPEQVAHYMPLVCPPHPGDARKPTRVAFALTEPIPFVGVETGLLGGKMRVASWEEDQEPMLHIDKRGRFITNMDFANVVTAAVDSADPRIKGSCIVILEKTDPGLWDSGVPTRKMVHQLSSTCDPVFNQTVPASRIVGGYTIKDGVIIPNYSHSEVIEAVFRRTRVTVGLMTSSKLLSSIEPIIRYQRSRFRGGETGAPGSPRFDLGLQTKQDVVHRLVDIWATGEAGAALGFETARLFDQLDPLDRQKDKIFAEKGLTGRSAMKAMTKIQQDAIECVDLRTQSTDIRDNDRLESLEADPLVQYAILDAQANVFCPACKLWNTGHGATIMREAISLMGGYGITEDCPGFLPHKWMDAQLEATYEGPEAVQRRQLSVTMTNSLFVKQFEVWINELRTIAGTTPGTGACTVASAMELWLWTVRHLQDATDANGAKLFNSNRHGITFPLADALCWLLASRQQILDVINLGVTGAQDPSVAEELPGTLAFFTDLCHVQAARAAGETARICGEVVFGYINPPGCSCCSTGSADQQAFLRMRSKLDGCLYGFGIAKDRAANALTTVMIPEALDYPM